MSDIAACSGFLNQKSIGGVQLFRNAFPCRLPYNLNVFDWYLRQWLETLQVSQAELSRRTDYPKAKVSDLVTGKQRYNRDVLNDIAKALNLQPHELLMTPEDVMAQRQMRHAASQIVRIPHIGTAGEPTDEAETRKAG